MRISTESDSTSTSTEQSPSLTFAAEPAPQKTPTADGLGMCPECVYCFWNICFGIFLFFTTAFMEPGDTAAIVTQCFAVVDIFAGLLSFVIIFKSARSIFVVLTVFAGMTTIVTALTIGGFTVAVIGAMPVPELTVESTPLQCILGAFLVIHMLLNLFSFFVFFARSCRSAEYLDNEYSLRTTRPVNENNGSVAILTDY